MSLEPSTFVGLIIPVPLVTPTGGGWVEGPLPIPLPPHRGTRSGTAEQTDRNARLTLISETAGEVLYPSAGPRRRLHRVLGGPHPPEGPWPVAAEYLSSMFVPDPAGFLILHFVLPGPPDLTSLAALVKRLTLHTEEMCAQLGLGSQFSFPSDVRVSHVTHAVWEDPLPVLLPDSPWPVEDQWMHYLVAADTPEHRLPDTDKLSLMANRVRLSRDWTALVMRDGMAMLALTPLSESSFHKHARVHARSVYLDAFLLGLIQRDAAQALDRKAAHAMATAGSISAATPEQLERSLLAFRSRLWSGHVADRGGNVDDITRAVQAQFRLPELVAKLTTDLGEIARYMQARSTNRREQATWLVGLVTAVFVVPSLVFSAAAVLAQPSVTAFLSCVLISVALLLGMWMVWRRFGSRWTLPPEEPEDSPV